MSAYYNEIEPYAAQWLRNLIDAGEIAPGTVDERDIRDVTPTDLAGYDRCHFFAGIGGWEYALRLAGWPTEWPVWTGSCPCQPFSSAGRGGRGADERHLWPYWFHLIRACRPPVIFGEQVASKDGLKWLDLVCSDLEAEGYAVGAADLCAAGVGAPHIRQRLWFVGYSQSGIRGISIFSRESQKDCFEFGRSSAVGELAHAPGFRLNGMSVRESGGEVEAGGVQQSKGDSGVGSMAKSNCNSYVSDKLRQKEEIQGEYWSEVVGSGQPSRASSSLCTLADADSVRFQIHGKPGDIQRQGALRIDSEINKPWTPLVWLPCRDGKFRPTFANILPLVDGSAFRLGSGSPLEGKSRAGMLRAAGNAIVPQCAAIFIKCVMEILNEQS